MAKSISMRDVDKLKNRLASLKRSSAKAREKAGESVERLLMSAEVGGTAFAFGQVQARYGGVNILGVPADLGVGIAANVMSILGVGRGMETHLANIGNGALAAYAFKTGHDMGVKSMQAAGKAIPQRPTRLLGEEDSEVSGESLSDIDLENLAAPIAD